MGAPRHHRLPGRGLRPRGVRRHDVSRPFGHIDLRPDDHALQRASTSRPPTPSSPRSRKQTGIKVRVRQRRRGRAHGADRAGGEPLPGRRLLHRELQLAAAARRQRPAGSRSTPSTLANVPDGRQRHQRRLGGGLGSRQRDGLQPEQAQRRHSCRPRSWTWPTRSGRARSRSPRRRPTSGRSSSSVARAKGRRGRPGVARGSEGQRRERRRRPRQRDDRRATSARAPPTWP